MGVGIIFFREVQLPIAPTLTLQESKTFSGKLLIVQEMKVVLGFLLLHQGYAISRLFFWGFKNIAQISNLRISYSTDVCLNCLVV